MRWIICQCHFAFHTKLCWNKFTRTSNKTRHQAATWSTVASSSERSSDRHLTVVSDVTPQPSITSNGWIIANTIFDSDSQGSSLLSTCFHHRVKQNMHPDSSTCHKNCCYFAVKKNMHLFKGMVAAPTVLIQHYHKVSITKLIHLFFP